MRSELVNVVTHLFGALLAIVALVLLLARGGSVWHIVGFSVFGASLILLYTASAAYHLAWSPRVKRRLRTVDHAMIYFLIAGTYTPICLTVLRGGWGWSLFGLVWAFAFLGTAWKLFYAEGRFSTLLYIAMGWLIVIAIAPLLRVLSPQGFFWLFLGGFFYTFGTLFIALQTVVDERWAMHEIFHLFVLAGSFSHFWLLFRYV